MSHQITGYLVLGALSALVFLVAFRAWAGRGINGVEDFVAGGRRVGLGLIASSVMMSWVWTTTILGSAEAGLWFGLTGGIHYAWAAIVPFLVFVPIALRLRRLMPKLTTFTEFIQARYGKLAHTVFLIYAVGVCFYVYTEQLIGAGILYQATFGISYHVVVLLTGTVVTGYIALGGLRGSLWTDVFQFFVFALATAVVLPWFLSAVGGPSALYDGMRASALGPADGAANPDLLRWTSTAGFRYGLTGLVVAMGQVLFAQGYYQRAISAVSDRQLRWGYLLGGILAWFPIPLAYGTILGTAGLALGSDISHLESTTSLAPFLVDRYLGLAGTLSFVVLTHMAATSTADTTLSGVQSIFIVDIYRRLFGGRPGAEARQLRFGRIMTIVFGAAGAGVALAAQGVSLLMFDIFSGILFAAPVGAFLFGVFSRRASSGLALVATALGLVGGLGAWILIDDKDLNWFVGNVISLGLPIVLLLVLTPLLSGRFDFSRLRSWRPAPFLDNAGDALPEEG
jgi:Na+/proline symporter